MRKRLTESEKQAKYAAKADRLRAEAEEYAKRRETTRDVNERLDVEYAHNCMEWSKGSCRIFCMPFSMSYVMPFPKTNQYGMRV